MKREGEMAKFGRIPTDFAMQIIGFIRRIIVKIGIFRIFILLPRWWET